MASPLAARGPTQLDYSGSSAARYQYTPATLAPGILASDAVINGFHGLLVAANDQQDAAEKFFQSHGKRLQGHLSALDDLVAAVQEEKRCLESQLHECQTQVHAIRDNKKSILIESDRLVQYLTADLARLDADEDGVDQQHAAVDERTAEMKTLLSRLEDRFEELRAEGATLREREAALSAEERGLATKRMGLQRLDRELDARLAERVRKEESIQMWARSLETREQESNRHQGVLLDRLRQLEHEERGLGIDRYHQTVARHVKPGGGDIVTSVRALMDDHDMSIERDIDREEIDCDDDEDI